MSGNCELGRGLLRREKNATEGGAGRFEKPAPDARAAPPEAHESLIGRKTAPEVPLTGLSSPQSDARSQRLSQRQVKESVLELIDGHARQTQFGVLDHPTDRCALRRE